LARELLHMDVVKRAAAIEVNNAGSTIGMSGIPFEMLFDLVCPKDLYLASKI
jgi:hypothetical protein